MTWELILWVYIALLIAGGVMGFVKAGSKASLIASLAFALPLALSASGVVRVRYLAEGVVVFLLLFFGRRLTKGGKFMPAGMMVILSLVTLILRFVLPHS